MPGTIPSWVAAGATTEPAPSENPEPSAYDADQIRAFGANASCMSSNAIAAGDTRLQRLVQRFHMLEMHPETGDQYRRTRHEHRELGRQHCARDRPRPTGDLGPPAS